MKSSLGVDPVSAYALDIVADAEGKLRKPELAEKYLMPYVKRIEPSAEEEQEMTTKQRKPRAKSPSKVGKGAAPQKAPKKNYFSTLMETPEGRELRRQWSTKPRKNGGRPKGVPDGYRKADIDPIRAEAKRKADKAVKIMAKEHNIEDDYAQEALRTAVEVMQVPGETRERLGSGPSGSRFHKVSPCL